MIPRKSVNRKRESNSSSNAVVAVAKSETITTPVLTTSVVEPDVSHFDQIDLENFDGSDIDEEDAAGVVAGNIPPFTTTTTSAALESDLQEHDSNNNNNNPRPTKLKKKTKSNNKVASIKKKNSAESSKKKLPSPNSMSTLENNNNNNNNTPHSSSSSSSRGTPSAKDRKQMEKLLALARQDAQEEFEKEKQFVLSQVPLTVQNQFGQVGFAKWGKQYLPAIIRSPYRVPPGPARNIWMDMFRKMQENGRPLDKMPYLVYWYGEEKSQDFYSLVPQSSFTPWSETTKKMREHSKNAEKKKEEGKNLTSEEKQKIRAMAQLQQDLQKAPEDRIRGDEEFVECYDLLSINDLEELSNTNLSSDLEEDEEEEDAKPEKGGKKKKRKLDQGENGRAAQDDSDGNDEDEGKKGGSKKVSQHHVSNGEEHSKSLNKNAKVTGSKKRNRVSMESNYSDQSKKAGSRNKQERDVDDNRDDEKWESPAIAEGRHGSKKKWDSGVGHEDEGKNGSIQQSQEENVEDAGESFAPVSTKKKKKKDKSGQRKKKSLEDGCEVPPEEHVEEDPGDEENHTPSDTKSGEDVKLLSTAADPGKGKKALGKKKRKRAEQTDDLQDHMEAHVPASVESNSNINLGSMGDDNSPPVPRKRPRKLKGGQVTDHDTLALSSSVPDHVKSTDSHAHSSTELGDEDNQAARIPKKKGKKSKGHVKPHGADEITYDDATDNPAGHAIENIDYVDPADGDEPKVRVAKKKGKKTKSRIAVHSADTTELDDPADDTVGIPDDEDPIPKKRSKKSKGRKFDGGAADDIPIDDDYEGTIQAPEELEGEGSARIPRIKKKSKPKVEDSCSDAPLEHEVGSTVELEDDGSGQVPKKKPKKSKSPVADAGESSDHHIVHPDEDYVTRADPLGDPEDNLEEDILSNPNSLERAKRMFEKNEKEFEPLLRQWLSAIAKKDVEETNRCISEVQGELSKLGARFIEVYNIANYLKETKTVLKQNDDSSGLKRLSDLRKALRDHYGAVKKKFPIFEPMLKFPDLASPDSGTNDGECAIVGVADHPTDNMDSPDINNSAIVSELSHEMNHEGMENSCPNAKAVASSAENGDKNIDWTRGSLRVETADPQRLMGIEFLRQMASHIPEGKVNIDSVAISIERELHDFVGGSVNRSYWERLHAIVAAVCGDLEPGSLMGMIENQEIKSPRDLVNLSDEKLFASFRGQAGEATEP